MFVYETKRSLMQGAVNPDSRWVLWQATTGVICWPPPLQTLLLSATVQRAVRCAFFGGVAAYLIRSAAHRLGGWSSRPSYLGLPKGQEPPARNSQTGDPYINLRTNENGPSACCKNFPSKARTATGSLWHTTADPRRRHRYCVPGEKGYLEVLAC